MQKKNHSYYIAKSRNHYLYYLTLEANQRGLVDWGISSKSFDFESQNSDLLLEKWFLALISIWYTLSFSFFLYLYLLPSFYRVSRRWRVWCRSLHRVYTSEGVKWRSTLFPFLLTSYNYRLTCIL
jgi:hypothetical protein